MKKMVLMAAGLLLASLARADVAATGEAIAAALNKRDVNATLRLIDADAVGRAVIKEMGLNAADRETVLKVFPNALRTNVDLGIRTIAGSNGSAKYLRSGQRNGRPFALVRYDLGDQGIDYVEYYLGKTDKVEDWYVHSMATLFSTSARLGLSSLLKTDSMLFALFGSRMTTEADAKPFVELRTSLQKQDFAGAYRTLERFPEDFRKTRQWALMRVAYGGRVDGDTHRAALRYLAQNFGKDPELQFMLIDHYFFEKQFDGALASLAALERAIGGEDGATANLRGSILIAARRFNEAALACRRSMALESDHKAGYWCLVTVGLNTKSGKIAVEGLKAYEGAFSVEFNLNELAAIAEYKEIAATPEFVAWRKSRR
ncbi:MAG TPA: hypothetical protein VL982_10800 [Burkholderiales bacterium]|nr:hypothetical protein [Burkholderiales bacterium]